MNNDPWVDLPTRLPHQEAILDVLIDTDDGHACPRCGWFIDVSPIIHRARAAAAIVADSGSGL